MGEEELIQYLRTLSAEMVYYQFNPGNAGDALIVCATYQIFTKCGIKYKLMSLSDELRGKIIVYSGGGNFVSYYRYAADFVKRFHRRAKKLIILPHTINSNEELLRELGSNVDIICREETSYNYVKAIARKANVMLMDDIAFSLDVNEALVKRNESFDLSHYSIKSFARSVRYVQCLLKNKWYCYWHKMHGPNKKRVLNCFRTDQEKTDISIPTNNIDVSLNLRTDYLSERTARRTTARLLRFLMTFDKIKTNRLHICVAGILLHKEVDFYPNSYYKNESVYNYSIKGKYPNVRWMG